MCSLRFIFSDIGISTAKENRLAVLGGRSASPYSKSILTSSRRQTLPRYGGGFQVCRLGGSRFFAGDPSPAPLRDCPPLLFDSFRAVAVPMYDQIASRTTIDACRKRDPVSMAAARAIL